MWPDQVQPDPTQSHLEKVLLTLKISERYSENLHHFSPLNGHLKYFIQMNIKAICIYPDTQIYRNTCITNLENVTIYSFADVFPCLISARSLLCMFVRTGISGCGDISVK